VEPENEPEHEPEDELGNDEEQRVSRFNEGPKIGIVCNRAVPGVEPEDVTGSGSQQRISQPDNRAKETAGQQDQDVAGRSDRTW